ncbi:MAG: NAD(P)/FAD-dependent oxidoreductase, partial [Sneathiella sp.]|nr:NAD(P)/FAD-dependent oxidoreductase [Sneathiella sp.]
MTDSRKVVAIVGAGPAGLIAAQELSQYPSLDIHIFEQKPSVARKFLIAGRGGLNLTHSEAIPGFTEKYEENAGRFKYFLARFSPGDLINWANSLGIETFRGSSGRIFPNGLKATPLLRAWLKALDKENIHFHLKQSWQQINENNTLVFKDTEGTTMEFRVDAILYAMG